MAGPCSIMEVAQKKTGKGVLEKERLFLAI
jgi:hypothetical protein